jgi:hypothetical protein
MERFFLVVKEKKVQQNEEQRRIKGGATLSLSLSLCGFLSFFTTSKLFFFFLGQKNKQTDTQKKNNTTGAEQSRAKECFKFKVQTPNQCWPNIAYIILYYIIFT